MNAKRTTPRRAEQLTSKMTPADWARLRAMTDEEIELNSAAERAGLPSDFWDHAKWVEPIAKEPISLRVDQDVLGWFRSLGAGYQTRMNHVLRSYMEHHAKPARGRKKAAAK